MPKTSGFNVIYLGVEENTEEMVGIVNGIIP
jgi:methanogenic corrinoid protein MtbC1